MRAFEKRDEERAKTDKAKNDFESVIYMLRGWLTDEENNPFIPSEDQDILLSQLTKEEDWLLEGEGDNSSY